MLLPARVSKSAARTVLGFSTTCTTHLANWKIITSTIYKFTSGLHSNVRPSPKTCLAVCPNELWHQN